MGFFIGSLIFLTLPIALVWVFSKVYKKVPFSWANGFKVVLCLIFGVFGIVGHLIYPQSTAALIPPFFLFPIFLSYVTGVIELAFVVLLWTRYQRQTGIIIMVYLVVVLPFNYYGWTIVDNSPNYVDDPYYMWIRTALQVVLIAYAWYGTRDALASAPE